MQVMAALACDVLTALHAGQPDPPRLCPKCQKPLVKRGAETRKQFAERRYCDRACAGVAKRAAPPPRQCAQCERALVWRDNESHKDFAKRRYCGVVCFNNSQRRIVSRLAAPKISPAPKPPAPAPQPRPSANRPVAWAPELTARLEQLVGDGVTFAAIGPALGITKNAAIGKSYRMGFGRREDAVLNNTQLAAKGRPTPKPSTPAPFPAVGLCVWPHGHPRTPEFRFCAAPAELGRPYCGDHMGVAYRKQVSDAA